MTGLGSTAGYVDIPCPSCGIVLHVPIRVGSVGRQMDDPNLLINLHADHDTLHHHALHCPGPPHLEYADAV